jgi:hypothetical protein
VHLDAAAGYLRISDLHLLSPVIPDFGAMPFERQRKYPLSGMYVGVPGAVEKDFVS